MLNILYLISHETYQTKMSRVRIHAMNALGKYVDLKWWGVGWDRYNNKLSVQQNIDNEYPSMEFDLVIVYKPSELFKFSEVKFPKCITYNEMYNFNMTIREIEESMVDLVICHHENDMKTYTAYYSNYHGQKNKNVKFTHIPHSAEQSIFMDKHFEKTWDILVVGRLSCRNTIGHSHYPLRDRMAKLIESMPEKYKCGIYKHPKSTNEDSHTDKYLIEFSTIINSAKICISCSGLPKSRFGKYVEIPMCNTVHCADLPDQDEKEFKNMLIDISMDMTDDEIINKLIYYLENNDELEKLRKYGYEWSKNYTQEKYAERFLEALTDFKNNTLQIRYG